MIPQVLPQPHPTERYITTVDAVEEMTGMDFPRLLDDDTEQTLEATALAAMVTRQIS